MTHLNLWRTKIFNLIITRKQNDVPVASDRIVHRLCTDILQVILVRCIENISTAQVDWQIRNPFQFAEDILYLLQMQYQSPVKNILLQKEFCSNIHPSKYCLMFSPFILIFHFKKVKTVFNISVHQQTTNCWNIVYFRSFYIITVRKPLSLIVLSTSVHLSQFH